jgi:hypothetical protein
LYFQEAGKMKKVLVASIVVLFTITTFTQAGTIADAVAAPLGSEVTIHDAMILSTVDLAAGGDYRSFQLRDATRAITVYGTNAQIGAALAGWAVGDGINITGVIATADGAFRLEPPVGGSVSGFAVSGRTSTSPFPFPTSALTVLPSDIGQPYESDLVCLQNVLFDVVGGSVFAVETNYDLAGGDGVVRVVGGDQGVSGQPIPTGRVNITGIVIPDPDGDGYVLAPRGIGDIVLVPEPATLLIMGLGGLALLKRRK